MGVATPCSFCKRPSLFEPADGVRVCEACAVRIGELARNPASVANIWDLTEPAPRGDVAAPGRPSTPRARDIQVEEVFRAFRKGVEAQASADAIAHADLAAAYAEMGLKADALRSAAIALVRGKNVLATETALRVLLGGRLLNPGGLRALKRRLRPF